MAATGATSSSSTVIETLYSGFKLVGQFDDDDQYESDEDGDVDEEISYVTLDLGQIHPTLLPSCSSCRIAVHLTEFTTRRDQS